MPVKKRRRKNNKTTAKRISIAQLQREITAIVAKRFDSLSLMSDYYFTAFMQENIPCMQVMLRVFTDSKDLEVTGVHAQHVVKNGDTGRGVRYDCLVHTKEHGDYDIEIENWPNGALELRMRYYAVMLDKENLKKGEKYNNLPPITIIVISPEDIAGKGEAITYVGRVYMKSATEVGESPQRFDDKELFMFVNAGYQDTSTPVGKIIHDLTVANSKPKMVKEFQDAMDRYMSTEEGRMEMSGKLARYSVEAKDWEHLLSEGELKAAKDEAIAEGRAEGHAEGRAEGKLDGIKLLAENLLANGALDRTTLAKTFRQMGMPMPI